MKIKVGDVIEFVGLEWNEPQWEFDHPTVILSPIMQYSPNGTSAETMIEDICIDLCIEADAIEPKEILDEDESKEFQWRGWNLQRMKSVAKNRLNGKLDWKSKYARATRQIVEFITEDGETSFKIIKTDKK